MTDLAPVRKNIQVEESRFRTAVSESLMQKAGSAVNLINYRQHQEHKFVANGRYGQIPGVQLPFIGLDGIYVFEFDAEIINYSIANEVNGTSGTTEIDIKRATVSGGAFTSIFSVTPKIVTTSTARTFFLGYDISETGTGQVWAPNATPPAGVTIGTFTTVPFLVNKGHGISVDLINRMVDAEDLSVVVRFRPR